MNTVSCSLLFLSVCCLRCCLQTDIPKNMSGEQNPSGDTGMKYSGVFKSLEAVKKCLHSEKYFNLPEVQELLKIFNANSLASNNEVVDRSQRKVFIVLEGIDASGKTTISNRLAKLISGRQLGTPPAELLGLREQFDKHELELRRAYYALGNYMAAEQVRQIYRTDPVIMDRFWHSTAAYAIAQQSVESYNATLPPEGDSVYEWPNDLLRPDIVFFLSVSESKRLDRLMRRKSKEVTREELKMKDDKTLREAMLAAYLRMKNPNVRLINANEFPKRVLKACCNTLTAEKLVQIENSQLQHKPLSPTE
ncbi:UMP-CMP kinase 2, mitochondrial-like isoform X2 [Homalodisca vitripennis]|uniref:UMP-CMP kinase 2, mitochondrial-like isoform X2 n=2 Tax=Homalodisca vitripennis TaxID=197043 RepID=UPI001EEA5864|nr:UMP-CMP kinase 2, mitochondrial-like isoform X2 [Homalodisca vitripennis]